MDITKALVNLRPGAEWSLNGDTYEGLQWLDKTQIKPTEEEVNEELLKVQIETENTKYQRLRAREYPDLKEFVDAYYWSQKGDDTKMNEYITKCDEVKNKHPKPQ